MSEPNHEEVNKDAELLATRLEGAMARLLLARARFYLGAPLDKAEKIREFCQEIDQYFESLHGGGAVR